MISGDIAIQASNSLLSEVRDNIAWIVFNNPDRMNAMSQEM